MYIVGKALGKVVAKMSDLEINKYQFRVWNGLQSATYPLICSSDHAAPISLSFSNLMRHPHGVARHRRTKHYIIFFFLANFIFMVL
jgi:hypothetical protein